MPLRLLLTPLIAALATAASGATRTWDGGDATANWSATANWNPNATIAAGDALVFPSGLLVADRTTNNNYAAGTAWAGLTFQDGGYVLNGNQLQLTGSVNATAAGTVTVNADLLLGANMSIIAGVGSTIDLTPSCTLNLNGHASALAATGAGSSILVRGPLAGSYAGNLNFNGPGTIELRGAKTFTANPYILNGAEVCLDNNSSFGSTANIVRVVNGSIVSKGVPPDSPAIHQNVEVSNGAGSAGIIEARTTNLTLEKLLTLSGAGEKEFRSSTFFIAVNGLAASGGQMVKRGVGNMSVGSEKGNAQANNIVTGPGLRVEEGVVYFNASPGVMAMGGTILNIGNSGGYAKDAEVQILNREQVDNATQFRVNSDGQLTLGDVDEEVSSLSIEAPGRIVTGSGTLTLTDTAVPVSLNGGAATATFTGNLRVATATQTWLLGNNDTNVTNDPNLNFIGSISGTLPNSTFVKDGEGDLTLKGDHTIPRIRSIAGLTFVQGNSPATDIEAGGSFFTYAGTARNITVTSGRFIVDGVLPGTLHNTVECVDFSMTPGAELSLTIGTQVPVPGTTHDQIRASGDVSLTGGKLVLFGGFAGGTPMTPGDEVILLSKNGTAPVTGIFDGLPEGSIVPHGDLTFYLSYHGGDGNDVSLSYIVPPTGVVRVWDGGSAVNSNWSTPANWVGDVAPQPGDELRFPATAARKNNTNDYPPGTTFHAVSVLGSGQGVGYGIGGNRIVLNTSLSFGSAAVSHFWGVPLTLGLAAEVFAAGDALIQISGAIDNKGHILTLNRGTGGGDTYFSGTISGSGRVHKTGPGTVTYFEQAHTYTGVTDILEGVLALKHIATLGAGGAPAVIHHGAVLELRNNEEPVTVEKPLLLLGTLRERGGNFPAQVNGVVGMSANPDMPVIETTGGQFAVNGSITGIQSWRKTGTGTLTLGGTFSNAGSGAVYVEAGELRLQKTGVDAVGSSIFLASAGAPATLTLGASNQIPDFLNVQINHPGAVFQVGTFQETIDTLYLYESASVTGSAPGRLTLKTLNALSPSGTAVISAPLGWPAGATGSLVVTDGTGTPDLRIAGAVYGDTVDKKGTGRVDFTTSIPQGGLASLELKAGSALFFANCRYTDIGLEGGLLGGQGVVGNIFAGAGGTVSPGASAGSLGGYKAVWNAATTFRAEIFGASPGTEFDQYAAFAPVDLGGATLSLTVDNGYDPAATTEFMIIRNVSGEAVAGTFAGLPEGGYISAAGAKVFRISYHGGDGDDVVLTRVDVGPPVIVQHGMSPGTGDHKGENDTHLVVQGTPGLTYLLEHSTDLSVWVPGESMAADLESGLMDFHYYSPEAQPRLFLRVRLP